MDLQTINTKLDNGQYKNPWQFCEDMRLMFDNAWLYNEKSSIVYKYCTRVILLNFLYLFEKIVSIHLSLAFFLL